MKITDDYLIKLKLPTRASLTSKIPYNEYSIRNNFDIYCQLDLIGNCFFWGECRRGKDFFIIKCDSIRAFQNIYKILSDKELVNETINKK